MRKGLPAIIALSALGNVFAQTFAFSRGRWQLGIANVSLGLRSPSETRIGQGRYSALLKILGL